MKSMLKAALLAATAAIVPLHAQADGHVTEIVTSQHAFLLTEIATGFEHPWGLDWLPDGSMIVTERPGRIRIVSADGTVSEPLSGLPAISSEFRDGLLDIAVSPNFADDATIFFAYSNKEGEARWQEVASATLTDAGLENVTVIFSSGVKVEKDQGFGARIRFDADGNLVISVGDHAVGKHAQDTANTLGSIIRIKPDGTPAEGNPGGDLHAAILAYGFKNPQGLAIAGDGSIWAVDHGGTGGGELNRVDVGLNYGWPVYTHSGGDAPRAVAEGDFAAPVFTWGAAPTVALSGLEVYTGGDFPHWSGDLFTGSLSQESLIRIMLDDAGKVTGTEYVIWGDIGRIRDVRQGPDGRLYVLNDDPEGGIFRIDPKG